MRVFVIADASRRKAKPQALLAWSPDPEREQGRFALMVSSGCDLNSLPLSLSFLAVKKSRCATAEESEEWVRSRIVPENRHNITEVLVANELTEYDELSLFSACAGRSSDDDYLAYEVRLSDDVAAELEKTLQWPGGEASDAARAAEQAAPFVDMLLSAIERRSDGGRVRYEYIALPAAQSGSVTASECGGVSREDGSQTAAKRVGGQIRSLRKQAGLTQKQLAARAGMTQTVLSRVESGVGNPTLALLEDLSAALGVQLDITLR